MLASKIHVMDYDDGFLYLHSCMLSLLNSSEVYQIFQMQGQEANPQAQSTG